MTDTTTKICTMCGEEKPMEEYRQYPHNKNKRYPYCNDCQAIENRRRYIEQLAEPTPEQLDELALINQLYDKRIEKGLKTFNRQKKGNCLDAVAAQLAKLG